MRYDLFSSVLVQAVKDLHSQVKAQANEIRSLQSQATTDIQSLRAQVAQYQERLDHSRNQISALTQQLAHVQQHEQDCVNAFIRRLVKLEEQLASDAREED